MKLTVEKEQDLSKIKIFNTQGQDDKVHRQMFGGNTTQLINLNNIKYQWAVQLYAQMRENFWIPQKIDLTSDVTDYENLTQGERKAYNGILSYLTFLDSVQTCNLPYLKSPITAPEVSLCFVEQLSQEGLHNQSYQYIIETILPPEQRDSIYDFWRTDKVLSNRCEYIANLYQNYVNESTPQNYVRALVADYALEGIYFYNGFIFFYNLASRQLMSGSADMFKMINRDELSHVRLYQKILPEAFSHFNVNTSFVYDLFDAAVNQEIAWTNHIVGDDILGITRESTEAYTKYLCNKRLKAIGLDELYPEVQRNPYKHLEGIADTEKDGSTKANFFESGVTSYVMSTGVEGWDEI